MKEGVSVRCKDTRPSSQLTRSGNPEGSSRAKHLTGSQTTDLFTSPSDSDNRRMNQVLIPRVFSRPYRGVGFTEHKHRDTQGQSSNNTLERRGRKVKSDRYSSVLWKDLHQTGVGGFFYFRDITAKDVFHGLRVVEEGLTSLLSETTRGRSTVRETRIIDCARNFVKVHQPKRGRTSTRYTPSPFDQFRNEWVGCVDPTSMVLDYEREDLSVNTRRESSKVLFCRRYTKHLTYGHINVQFFIATLFS